MAVSYYRQAAELYGMQGVRHSEADALTHLGESYLRLGEAAAAQKYWHRALAILGQLQHPDAAGLRARLGQLPPP